MYDANNADSTIPLLDTYDSMSSITKNYQNYMCNCNDLEKIIQKDFKSNITSIETSFASLSIQIEELERLISKIIQTNTKSYEKTKLISFNLIHKFEQVNEIYNQENKRFHFYRQKEKQLDDRLYTKTEISEDEKGHNENNFNMYESEFKNIKNFIKQIHQVNKKLSLLFISTNHTNNNTIFSTFSSDDTNNSSYAQDSLERISQSNDTIIYSRSREHFDLYNAVYFVLVGVIAIFVILFIYKSYSK